MALSPFIWRSTQRTFAAFGVAIVSAGVLMPGPSQVRLVALGCVILSVAAVMQRVPAPEPGSPTIHLILAATYVGPALAMVAFSPEGSAGLAAAVFTGPLASIWLVDRRQIAAHFLAAAVVLFTPSMLGLVGAGTLVACIALVPATLALGGICVVVLEAAESQGAELAELVERDPLTGVGNRRLLEERLEFEFAPHRGRRDPLTIITLDLDGFKHLNDTLGHAAGDAMLCHVASVLQTVTGRHDAVVRQGGDEFCVVLPGQDAAGAAAVVDAIRSGLADLAAGVSAGIGLASYPADGADPVALLELADQRLIADKALARPARPVTPPAGSDGDSHTTSMHAPHGRLQAVAVAGGPITRAELSRHPMVWGLNGGMYILFAVIGFGILRWTPDLVSPAFAYVVFAGLVVGLAHLCTSPPNAESSLHNHVVIALTYIVPALIFASARPESSIGVGSAIFVAPLAGVRLIERRHIAAHLAAASTIFLSLIPFGMSGPSTFATIALVASFWIQASLIVVTLELAESQSAELAEMAVLDPLTGVGNRRRLHEYLVAQLAGRLGDDLSATPDASPLAVVAFDLNGFKILNDTQGHAAGDTVLRETAAALTGLAEPGDAVVRQGGDEFCVVLGSASAADADAFARRAVDALAEVDCGGRPLSTGIGVARYPDDGGARWADLDAPSAASSLLQLADERLMRNKQATYASSATRHSSQVA